MIIVDDFGLNKKVNELVIGALDRKIINGAAILVNCVGSINALQYVGNKQKNGSVGQFGIHLNFSEGKPVLPASHLPTLTDKNGFFYSWQKFVIRTIFGAIKKNEIISEARAQIEKYQQAARVDFVNSHHHLHLLPTISGDIVKLAKTYQIKQIRCPKKSWLGLEYQHLIKAFTIQLLGKLSKIKTNDSLATYLADLDWVGKNQKKIKLLLLKLPGDCEIICHPHPTPSTLGWLCKNKNKYGTQ